MYSVAVQRNFAARHYLIGGDWGAENEEHAHAYCVQVLLEGEALDEHGYLVDIVDVEAALEALIGRYRNRVLNELPEFAGLNPSIERFSHILWQGLSERIKAPNLARIKVQLWENENAWAAYEP